MNTGQTLLAVGSIMLVGFIVLRNTNVILGTDESLTRSKIKIVMTDYAQTIIESASSKRFAEVSVNTPIRNLNSLELPASLVCEEDITNTTTFDDYDDYNRDNINGYTYDTYYAVNNDSIPLRVKVHVYYVDPKDVSLSVKNERTWYKKMDINVSVLPGLYSYMQDDTVKVSRIFSFFRFGIN